MDSRYDKRMKIALATEEAVEHSLPQKGIELVLLDISVLDDPVSIDLRGVHQQCAE